MELVAELTENRDELLRRSRIEQGISEDLRREREVLTVERDEAFRQLDRVCAWRGHAPYDTRTEAEVSPEASRVRLRGAAKAIRESVRHAIAEEKRTAAGFHPADGNTL